MVTKEKTDQIMPARVLATEHGLVVEDHPDNEAYFKHRRDQIGKRKLNHTRPSRASDELDGRKVIGDSTAKEALTDEDAREISVAKIDEKILDLLGGDVNSPGNTKERNDLRDMKAIIVGLRLEGGLGYGGVALKHAEDLEAEGRSDEASLARGAAELLSEARDGYINDIDLAADDYEAARVEALKATVLDHNARVDSNAVRQAVSN